MECFICGQGNEAVLQTHHIVPRRYGGDDSEENLATLCASCHQAVEKLYDKRFYTELGVEEGGGVENEKLNTFVTAMALRAKETREEYEDEFGDFPSPDDIDRYGPGELAGYNIGFVDAAIEFISGAEKHLEGVDSDYSDYPYVKEMLSEDSDGEAKHQ